jgi:cytochrome d ubiquinol oxidase subunit I
MLGIAAWHLSRKQHLDVMRKSAAFAAVALLVGSLGVALTGHFLGQVMVEVQPMKMASAEALWDTEQPAAFSLFAVGDKENNRNLINVAIPGALSLLSCNNFDCEVRGINDLQAEMVANHGPGDYIPNIFITYWGFRLMVGSGTLMILIGALGVWFYLTGKIEEKWWFMKLALWAGIAAAFLGNATGWIFTEMGRQPWVVYEVLLTEGTNSPTVPAAWVASSLIGFSLLYGILAVPAVYLFVKFAKAGPGDETDNDEVAASMVY